MRPQDIKINESYRLKSSPRYGFVRVLVKLKANEKAFTDYGILKNPKRYAIVYCEHTVDKNGTFGFKRYFKPSDLIKIEASR